MVVTHAYPFLVSVVKNLEDSQGPEDALSAF